jgi:hypothetical protein
MHQRSLRDPQADARICSTVLVLAIGADPKESVAARPIVYALQQLSVQGAFRLQYQVERGGFS